MVREIKQGINRKNSQKGDLLFLAATHGDEGFSIKLLKQLDRKIYQIEYSWMVANEKALVKKVRYIDADLNRVAPGSRTSKKYEPRRAYEILQLSKSFRYIIDIHGTSAKTGIFTIVTNPKKNNLLLAATLPMKNVVIWRAERQKITGPLTQFMNCGLEIECGPKDSKKIQTQLAKILFSIVNLSQTKTKKTFFEVYGALKNGELKRSQLNQLKEFKKVRIAEETFYPLLVGRYEGIVCYKMKKISVKKFLS